MISLPDEVRKEFIDGNHVKRHKPEGSKDLVNIVTGQVAGDRNNVDESLAIR